MINLDEMARRRTSPRLLAQCFLGEYFKEKQLAYPVNPFQMLKDLDVPFVFRAFDKIEGLYLPATDPNDISIVGINIKRPITRQRYTAAHELCHHIRDRQSSVFCDINMDNPIERFAEKFAAELLMPIGELRRQVAICAPNGDVSLDNVLHIAEYFGVSFTSCLQRIMYELREYTITGAQDKIASLVKKYKPDKKRAEKGYSQLLLYEQLIDAIEENVRLNPGEFIKAKFCNEYIYNDSRLEGVETDRERVAEVVADIRLHGADSRYCREEHRPEVEVAGHSMMYSYIFDRAVGMKPTIYMLLLLHQHLYSCAPDPSFGGQFRTSNPLVLGAKFETIDHSMVPSEIACLEAEVQSINESQDMTLSQFIERIVRLHHKLTIIHPFADGNGRSSRGFLNLFLLQRRIIPIYIRVDDKEKYFDALMAADTTGEYERLYIAFFQAMLRSQIELTEAAPF